jgi:homoserine dehydrogenase
VLDQPGVIAHIGAAMRDEAVSISRLSQHGRGTAANRNVSVVFTTHETDEAAMNRVLARIEAHPAVVARPSVIRIEAI